MKKAIILRFLATTVLLQHHKGQRWYPTPGCIFPPMHNAIQCQIQSDRLYPCQKILESSLSSSKLADYISKVENKYYL